MNVALAIFVKTPGLSPLKTRLAAGIGEDQALAFYERSVVCVEEATAQSGLVPYWAVGEADGMGHSLWSRFEKIYTGEGGLGARQHRVYSSLLRAHDGVILIGADAPQLSADRLKGAALMLRKHDFVIGPAHDGGYTLFGGRMPIDLNVWENVTWSSDTTRSEFESLLPSEPFHLPALSDVDEADDLQHVVDEMPKDMSDAQRELVAWISNR